MSVRILFGVMSATQSGGSVDQLCRQLSPHRVVIHHDFEKRADFAVSAPNAEFVKDPRLTGWGTWGFSDAILHTIRYALDRHEFDYFQLLSPTCLPIRPLRDFERHIAQDPCDAHLDAMQVDADDDALMTFGYRTFMQARTLRFRVLRKVSRWYFGEDSDLVQTTSLSMRRRPPSALAAADLPRRAGLALTRLAAHGGLGRHPFGASLRPMIGGVFFGARRATCERLLRIRHDEQVLSFFQGLHIVDETLFPTLLCNAGLRIGPANHAINDFTPEGSPRWIELGDLERLCSTGRFFARKFPDDPDSPVRRRVLDIIGTPAFDRGDTPVAVEQQSGAVPAAHAATRRGPRAAPRAPRIVFGLMSSHQPAATVAQLVDALAPHPVVVHHDFDKLRDFSLACPNAFVVPDPRPTGWGSAGFTDAVFHTIRHALQRYDADYFQLLSPTCLPIRPLEDFVAHVRDDPADYHADLMDVEQDDDVLMSFAYRTYVPGRGLRFRLLRRIRESYFSKDAVLEQRQSLSVLRPPATRGRVPLGRRGALAFTRLAATGRFAATPYGAALRPAIGSIWFGARRDVCEHLLRAREDARAMAFFRRLHIVDETLFPTLLANAGFVRGPSNHVISPFDANGHPRWIEPGDLDRLIATERFFARKFPADHTSEARARALERLHAETIAE